ncbi:hypothetical protein [Rhodococcoides fascians]|uniref:hypothetical protein n=1 Tax=Rhodococcoides fascians TaxID=1828 RepID=UPI00050BE1FC|nr:hypothetical protein [Rhodococcus fascians]
MERDPEPNKVTLSDPVLVQLPAGTPLPRDAELALTALQAERIGAPFVEILQEFAVAITEMTVQVREFVDTFEPPKGKHTPPMWAVNPAKQHRTRRLKGHPTKQGKN